MIETTQRGDIAILKMARGKANALDVEFCAALIGKLEELRTSSPRAVILTGEGSMFSAGVNLLRALNGGPAYIRELLPVMNKAFETLFWYEKPVIAAINGHAIAGGCVLACGADKRLMARDAGRIGVTELLVGLPFPPIAFEIMRFVTAPEALQEIIFTGATYAPEAAAERGLIDRIVEPSALIDEAIADAEALAALSSPAFALTKRQMRQAAAANMERDGRTLDVAVTEIWTATESADRIRAYVSRTFKKL